MRRPILPMPQDDNRMPVPRRIPRAAAMAKSRVPLARVRRPAQMNVMHAIGVDRDAAGPAVQPRIGAGVVRPVDVGGTVQGVQRDAA